MSLSKSCVHFLFLFPCVVCLHEEEGPEDHFLPHKHDIISVLAVGGHWVTSHSHLQVGHKALVE